MFSKTFSNWLLAWAGFAVSLLGISAAYAALAYLASVGTASSWLPVSSTEWNKIVSNFTTIDAKLSAVVPTGWVMAFVGTSCPTGWSPANGTPNGVKKTDGTATTLDLRGEFIRGLDGGRNVDPSRSLGSSQPASQVMWGGGNPSPPYLSGNNWVISIDNGSNVTTAWQSNLEQVTYGSYNGNFLMWWSGYMNWATSWNVWQVRPRNVALLYCVKD